MNTSDIRDLVIIGAGPAGLSASIYASRALLDAIVLEQTSAGGQVLQTDEVENYPGTGKMSGWELMDAMQKQARELGATIQSAQVKSIERTADNIFALHCSDEVIYSKSVILATGATPYEAGFTGEKEFKGRGVSYCATCDGMFYRNKHVFVVGGGNTATEEALFLTRFASKVTMIVRKNFLRAQAALAQEAEQNEKLEIRYHTKIDELTGADQPNGIVFRNTETDEISHEAYEPGSFGVFVCVGHKPSVDLVRDLVDLSATDAVTTDVHMATKTPGLYCAGDVRDTVLRQIVTAVADGAIAATSVVNYLKELS